MLKASDVNFYLRGKFLAKRGERKKIFQIKTFLVVILLEALLNNK